MLELDCDRDTGTGGGAEEAAELGEEQRDATEHSLVVRERGWRRLSE